MAAHSEESEIYRCNDPRQDGGEEYFPSTGRENLRLSEIKKEKCTREEKGVKGTTVDRGGERSGRAGRAAGGIRAVEG